MSCGFTKGVSVDVLYLQINDFLEYNLPYMNSDYSICNLGPMSLITGCSNCGRDIGRCE